mmetsp:Transcript_11755/g.40594  ORF Transcript_11755/g.40594 Transcript_11755/m.40594 type:complete len:229 (-) Transcript_11755:359-1045(-)
MSNEIITVEERTRETLSKQATPRVKMSNGDAEWKKEPHVDMSEALMAGGLPRSLHSVDKLSDTHHSPHTPQDFAAAYDNVKELERILRMNIDRLNHIEEDRNVKWKDEAIKHGLKMVDEERKRGDAERMILLKRIEFLSEELEESKNQLVAKTKECDELFEVAQELSEELSQHVSFDEDEAGEAGPNKTVSKRPIIQNALKNNRSSRGKNWFSFADMFTFPNWCSKPQ